MFSVHIETSQWSSVGTQRAHEKSISVLAAYDDIVLTGSSDGIVKVWKLDVDDQSGWCNALYSFSPGRLYLLGRQTEKYPNLGSQKAIPSKHSNHTFTSVNW